MKILGLDVGSTTVKCCLVESDSLEILHARYVRHETRQAEKTLELIEEVNSLFPELDGYPIFITGSGATPLMEPLDAQFVQEVNAVTLAVEQLHPDVKSVVELGGQDAKIIIFQENATTGQKNVFTSMNDKCASGTGATIDKCMVKVGLNPKDISKIKFDPSKLHHVAAKCGVFAETDIVNLIKSSIPADEIMNSLADAIVMQNLSVLTRGNTLQSKVLLLGGPNTYLPFLKECWKMRIPEIWKERGYEVEGDIHDIIFAPENSQYYAAFGAVVFGLKNEFDENVPKYINSDKLKAFISKGRGEKLKKIAGPGLSKTEKELDDFIEQYTIPKFQAKKYPEGSVIKGYLGIDGGSTTSKLVLMGDKGEVIYKGYLLSKGNPIQDAKDLMSEMWDYAKSQKCTLKILGCGATGYAADVLEKAIQCDATIVETIAHAQSAIHYFGSDVDVICDIGGQDIKVLFLHNGTIRNFRLSNQCSAGNGMLLQAMADQFGEKVENFAPLAFKAEFAPVFSYGCAVFLDTDRVNFQKEGFSKSELFSGLAQVLPKNIWQYVVQIPRMSSLGKKYVLQGGTQKNMAAVKAQVDYIKQRVPDAEIVMHPHCGEGGAIGAALEAKRVVERKGRSVFMPLEDAMGITYTTKTDESTRCRSCHNQCMRTFIDIALPAGDKTRYIAGFSCERGTVESKEEVAKINKEREERAAAFPNLIEFDHVETFKNGYDVMKVQDVNGVSRKEGWFGFWGQKINAVMGGK